MTCLSSLDEMAPFPSLSKMPKALWYSCEGSARFMMLDSDGDTCALDARTLSSLPRHSSLDRFGSPVSRSWLR